MRVCMRAYTYVTLYARMCTCVYMCGMLIRVPGYITLGANRGRISGDLHGGSLSSERRPWLT